MSAVQTALCLGSVGCYSQLHNSLSNDEVDEKSNQGLHCRKQERASLKLIMVINVGFNKRFILNKLSRSL